MFLALRGLMTLKAKPWHESEHYKHGEVDGTRDSVSAGQVFAQRLALKGDRKAELCKDYKSKGEEPNDQGTAGQMNCGELAQHVPRSEEDSDSHDGHFRQLGPPLTDARHDKRNANHAEQESRAEHDGEVNDSSSNGDKHDLRSAAAALCWI